MRWLLVAGLMLLLALAPAAEGPSPATTGPAANAPRVPPPRPEGTQTATLRGRTMGTTYRVVLPGAAAGRALDDLGAAIETELERLEAVFSTYRRDSEVSRWNAGAARSRRPVSGDLCRVLIAAEQLHQVTDGALDVTVGPLVKALGFGPAPVATAPPLAALRARVGAAHLDLDAPRCQLGRHRDGVEIDPSAIAKGYAVDRIGDLLIRADRPAWLVEIGGEVRVRGKRSAARPWRLAVEHPGASRPLPALVVRATSGALATSGSYRQLRWVNGRRVTHVVDPRTGESVHHDLVSVTVAADGATSADGLATALLVLGPEAGPARARRLKIAAVFLVGSDRPELIATRAWRARFGPPAAPGARAQEPRP